jgi:hypothetical protein
MVVYGVLPYAAVDADRIIEQLWVLAGLEVGQADEDLAGAERCGRRSSSSSRPPTRDRILLDLWKIERQLGRSPWRDLL